MSDNNCFRKFDKEYKSYINVKVSTISKKAAKNCQAFITKIEKIEQDGNILSPMSFDPIACICRGKSTDPIDIDFNAPCHFDLFYTYEMYDTKLNLCGQFPKEIANFFDEKGIYIFTGYVKSENITKEYEVGIEWNGEWDGITEYKPKSKV